MPSDKNAANDIDDLDEELEDTVTVLLHCEHDWLDVILDKDARNLALADFLALLSHSVLVGTKVAAAMLVESGHHREVVLEHVEVDLGRVDSTVERVDQARVERSVGQFGDDV